MEAIIGAEYQKKVAGLVDEAKRTIDIVSYDWRWLEGQPGHPVQQFNIALVRARQRGVQIRAVLNTAEIIPTLQKVGIDARQLKDKRVLHAKLILIDGTLLVIGSHNITRNAFGTNIEASVAIELPEGSSRFQEFFNNLYGL